MDVYVPLKALIEVLVTASRNFIFGQVKVEASRQRRERRLAMMMENGTASTAQLAAEMWRKHCWLEVAVQARSKNAKQRLINGECNGEDGTSNSDGVDSMQVEATQLGRTNGHVTVRDRGVTAHMCRLGDPPSF